MEVAMRLAGSTEAIQPLGTAFQLATEISHRLQDCEHFTLLDAQHLELLGQADSCTHEDWFWRQVNQLLILLTRTFARATLNVIDGLTWTLGNRNELLLALSLRFLLEHAAALRFIESKVSPAKDRLRNDVWPNRLQWDAIRHLTTEDLELRCDLIRFAVGRIVQMSDEEVPLFSDKTAEWKAFTRSMRTAVPERFKAIDLRDLIDSMADVPGQQILRPIYNLISEYCHPNSASRTIDFNVAMSEEFKHHISSTGESEFSAGFVRLFAIFRKTSPTLCKMIDDGLKTLDDAHAPVPLEPHGSRTPIPHGTPVVDDFGRKGWVHSGRMWFDPARKKVELTERQKERVTAIHDILGPVRRMSLVETFDAFAAEAPGVEEEIRIWQQCADVFKREAADRNTMSHSDQVVLLGAIVKSYEVSNVEELLVVWPDIAGFPDLERLLLRMKGKAD
jgi:hypothetical protein